MDMSYGHVDEEGNREQKQRTSSHVRAIHIRKDTPGFDNMDMEGKRMKNLANSVYVNRYKNLKAKLVQFKDKGKSHRVQK
jgi:hypothetical protein